MRVAATMRSSGGRAVPAAVPAGIALAWAALLLAELVRAPLSHDELAGGSLPPPAAVGVFALGWVAMVTAMMLPSSYPMIRAYAAVAAPRPAGLAPDAQAYRRPAGLGGFLGGYVAVWTVFGLALFAGDLGLHALLDGSSRPFAGHATLLGNALLIAGAFQLTERKRRCLDRCRHPGEFLRHHGAAGAGAFRLGREYGVHCLGSCWALMLAVFALGKPELLWMALFGAVMVYEKIGRHGLLAARLAAAILLAGSLAATFA
jgi:predicted metal-binding membrane protein